MNTQRLIRDLAEWGVVEDWVQIGWSEDCMQGSSIVDLDQVRPDVRILIAEAAAARWLIANRGPIGIAPPLYVDDPTFGVGVMNKLGPSHPQECFRGESILAALHAACKAVRDA